MLQSTLLKEFRPRNSNFFAHFRVNRLHLHPISRLPAFTGQLHSISWNKTFFSKGYWLKVMLTFSKDFVLRTLIQIFAVTF
jgi:hypothetical protein